MQSSLNLKFDLVVKQDLKLLNGLNWIFNSCATLLSHSILQDLIYVDDDLKLHSYSQFTILTLDYISTENQFGYIYRIQKWGQNLQKMGSGYEHFHPKFDSAPLKAKKIYSQI